MEAMDHAIRTEWHVDFGQHGRMEADIEESRVWLALPEVLGAEIWIKGVAGSEDFRLQLMRRSDGFNIEVDRGDDPRKGWPKESPVLSVTMNPLVARGTIDLKAPVTGAIIWRSDFPS